MFDTAHLNAARVERNERVAKRKSAIITDAKARIHRQLGRDMTADEVQIFVIAHVAGIGCALAEL